LCHYHGQFGDRIRNACRKTGPHGERREPMGVINRELTFFRYLSRMSYEAAALDATLAAAAGDDEVLFAELRGAFLESAAAQVDLLRGARCDANWELAALRLKGLAAGFHAFGLIALAEEALDGAPGNAQVLQRLDAFLASLTNT
jgi:hypothetical protein